MKKYAMTCSCGMTMTVDANSLEEAKTMYEHMMLDNDMAGAKQHWVDPQWGPKHAGQTMPTADQIKMMIGQGVHEAAAMG